MNEYPEVITPEILSKYALIPDEEIRKDIVDTEAEISQLLKAAEAYEVLANLNSNKLAWRQCQVAEIGAIQRTKFVAFLEKVLSARAKTALDNVTN